MVIEAATMLLLVNSARAIPLKESAVLDRIAYERVESLCNKPLSHTGFLSFFDGTKFGYVGENLARGFSDPQSLHSAWMNSPAHNKVLINPVYEYFGFASACNTEAEEFAKSSPTQ